MKRFFYFLAVALICTGFYSCNDFFSWLKDEEDKCGAEKNTGDVTLYEKTSNSIADIRYAYYITQNSRIYYYFYFPSDIYDIHMCTKVHIDVETKIDLNDGWENLIGDFQAKGNVKVGLTGYPMTFVPTEGTYALTANTNDVGLAGWFKDEPYGYIGGEVEISFNWPDDTNPVENGHIILYAFLRSIKTSVKYSEPKE